MIRGWCIFLVAVSYLSLADADDCVPGTVWEDKVNCLVYNCTALGMKISPSKTCPGRCYDSQTTNFWHAIGTTGVSEVDCYKWTCTKHGWEKHSTEKDPHCVSGGCKSTTTGQYHEIGFSIAFDCIDITCTEDGWILPPTDECDGKCFDNTTNKWWNKDSTSVMSSDCYTYTCDEDGTWVNKTDVTDANCDAGGCKSGETGKYHEVGFYFEFNCVSFKCTNNTEDNGWIIEKLPGCGSGCSGISSTAWNLFFVLLCFLFTHM
ncbi:unnamed protein product [Meganyctiphanes norvegica]|uniref:Uncharacterized protein n=1 Tax=Meganyctiphanes norvegica TaxID=48144 RepID=A0AAV2QJ50_MEGNR